MKTHKGICMGTVSIFLFVFGTIIFWGFQVFGQEWTDEQKEIWKIVEVVFNAQAKQDVGAFLKYCHQDSVFWPSTSGWPVKKEEFKEIISGRPIKEGKLTPYEIKIFGNVAIVQNTWSGFCIMDQYWSGRTTTVLIKQDDKWQIIGYMSTSKES